VAILGRPNVGKSTLFNRILGGRPAIVSDRPGTTRDRHFGDAEWAGRRFWVVDTGGLIPDSTDAMDRAVRRQVEIAEQQADLILFVVDGLEGLNPVDQMIAERLRRSGRPVVLAVNKLDRWQGAGSLAEFYALGLGDPHPVSAAVGTQSGDLLDAVVARLPPPTPVESREAIQVAIIGRPNVGKSSLANRLLGEERYVVSPLPGTTRDAVDTPLRYRGRTLVFIDTAGLRRRSKVDDAVEFYATVRTTRAIERADVCILVVDAATGVTHQDLRVAGQVWERGKGLIVAVNKWDLVPDKEANTARRGQQAVVARVPFLRYVPFVYVSARTGQRVRRLLDQVIEVAEARRFRVRTSELNRVLGTLLERQAPPQKPGEEIRLLYASQVETEPPVFAIVSNRPQDVPESYRRYLLHGFRAAWPFPGVPLRVRFTARGAKAHLRAQGDRRQ
jgi:GTP-binding protein